MLRKNFVSSIKGFTLVELMVVVAIIGLLAAVAVPNFKKYQTKTKMSEAKVQLSGLYMVEQTAVVDYDTYATCISDLGFDPGSSTSRYYAVGFTTDESTGRGIVTTAGATCNSTTFVFAAGKKGGSNSALTAVSAGRTTTTTTFTAGADGIVSSTNATDKWTINHQKATTWTPGW